MEGRRAGRTGESRVCKPRLSREIQKHGPGAPLQTCRTSQARKTAAADGAAAPGRQLEEVMYIEIRSQGFSISEALQRYSERRLGFALRKFSKDVGRVTVRLSDLNGPRGGADKRCQITASVLPSQAVSLQAVDADLYAAIDRAAARLERALARCLARTRESRRGRMSIRKPEGIRLQPLESPQ